MSKKNALFPVEYDEISLVDSGGGAADDGSIAPSVLIMKRAACVAPSSTGAKTGKSSQRAKNWAEGKHPREAGKFSQSSSESKSKYGKGGTTSAKQEAECRSKKKKGKTLAEQVREHEKAANKELRDKGLKAPKKKKKGPKKNGKGGGPQLEGRQSDNPVKKSWITDAHVRALMERKAAR